MTIAVGDTVIVNEVTGTVVAVADQLTVRFPFGDQTVDIDQATPVVAKKSVTPDA
jgi:hypothetical protein